MAADPALRPEARSKYRNVKTVVDGVTLDSRKEAQRYAELKLLQRAKVIRGLERQPPFELRAWTQQAAFYEVVGIYRADFRYFDCQTHAEIIEDVKSDATRKLPLYRLKKKLVEASYGIRITEI